MRIAVVSDTHMPRGGRALPAACIERLRAADLIVHAGDLSSVGFLTDLRAFGPPVEAVRGNVDDAALQELLPETRVVEAGGARIGVMHDGGPRAGREERLIARFPGCDAIVYGHSHLPQLECRHGVWILNPGAPTERGSAPTRTMIELVVETGAIAAELVHLEPS
jgi:putative phosphoesterase